MCHLGESKQCCSDHFHSAVVLCYMCITPWYWCTHAGWLSGRAGACTHSLHGGFLKWGQGGCCDGILTSISLFSPLAPHSNKERGKKESDTIRDTGFLITYCSIFTHCNTFCKLKLIWRVQMLWVEIIVYRRRASHSRWEDAWSFSFSFYMDTQHTMWTHILRHSEAVEFCRCDRMLLHLPREVWGKQKWRDIRESTLPDRFPPLF